MISDNRQSTCIIVILIIYIILLAAIFCVLFWRDKVVRFAVKPSIKPIKKRSDTQAKKRMETGKTTKSTKSTTQRSDDSERSAPNPSRSAESVGEPTKASTNWNDMPMEIKMMILKEMTFETRSKLKICSKSDRMMVHCIPLAFGDIRLWTDSWNWGIVVQRPDESVLFEVEKCDENTMKISFNGKTRMRTYGTDDEAKEIVNQYALSIFATIFNTTSVTIGSLEIDFTFPNEYLDAINRPVCTKIGLCYAQATNVIKYINKFSTTDFEVWDNFVDDDVELEDIETIELAMNYDRLILEMPNNINDEQLLRFEGKNLLLGATDVTSIGLNLFVKKITAADQYSTRDNFEIGVKSRLYWNELIEGIRCWSVSNCWDVCFGYDVAPGKRWYLGYTDYNSTFHLSKSFP